MRADDVPLRGEEFESGYAGTHGGGNPWAPRVGAGGRGRGQGGGRGSGSAKGLEGGGPGGLGNRANGPVSGVVLCCGVPG